MAERALGTKLMAGTNHVTDLTGIEPPSKSSETIDVTTLESEGGYREYINGFKDAGEVGLTGFFTATQGQKYIDELFESGEEEVFTIIYPRRLGASQTFRGIVTASRPTSIDVESAIGYEATVKVNGPAPLVYNASSGLTALTITGTGGALAPTFSNANEAYTYAGLTASSITITATAASQTIDVYVNNKHTQKLTSGVASSAITISAGSATNITLIVKAEDKAPVYYEIMVSKA